MQIDKGVPLPTGSGSRGRGHKSELRCALESMDVGDSVATGIEPKRLTYIMQNTGRGQDATFTRRKDGEGHRIWRIR